MLTTSFKSARLPKVYPRKWVRVSWTCYRLKAAAITARAKHDRITITRGRQDELDLIHPAWFKAVVRLAVQNASGSKAARSEQRVRRIAFRKPRPL